MIVSIITPCYNRKDMLRECIGSFIKQTFTDWEMVIADDCSEDDLSFVSSLDRRIKYFRQSFKNYPAAYNLAQDNARGKYIMPFDSDDLASNRDMLKILVDFLDNDLNCDAVYSDHDYITKDGERGVRRFRGNPPQDPYISMLRNQYLPHAGMLWRRHKKPRYDESLPSGIDLELYLQALESGVVFKHINKRLWTLRQGHDRETGTKRQIDGVNITLGRRGWRFDEEKHEGVPIK